MVVGQAVRVDSGLAQVVGRLIFGITKAGPEARLFVELDNLNLPVLHIHRVGHTIPATCDDLSVVIAVKTHKRLVRLSTVRAFLDLPEHFASHRDSKDVPVEARPAGIQA